MQIEVHSPTRSTASGLIAHAFGSANQSRFSCDETSGFAPRDDSPKTFLDTIIRIVFGKYSLAISSDAMWLRKAEIKLAHDLYFKWQTEDKPVASPEQIKLSTKLLETFETDPLESGIDHPAEQIITKALQSPENQQVFDWFKDFSLDVERPSFAASVLRCLGRQTNLGEYSWRAELVRGGLAADDVEIRDAAVQAAESWGDQGLVSILKSHHESESWLREYILDVINDLGG